MEDLTYDVVVVGGGPAGSVTSKYAAINGAKVLMIEKRQEIGSPVRCGEGIARVWLDEVGIEPNPKWIAHEVDGARLISPDGKSKLTIVKHAGNEVGYVVDRDEFDKELARDAARNGVDIMVKTSAVSLLKDGDKVVGVKAKRMGEEFNIYAKIVVGADGYESNVARWAGINVNLSPEDVMTCFQYTMVGIEGDNRFNDFYLGNEDVPGGYVWVFWKGKDTANVGLGVNMARIAKGEKGVAKAKLDAFIKKHPELSKGKPVEEIAGACSVCAPLDSVVTDNVILVGDSARMIDPITGGGVANACKAGQVAGEVIGEALKKNDFSKEFFKKYEDGWRGRIEDQMLRNYIAKEKFEELDDDVLNSVIEAISEMNLPDITTRSILQAIQEKRPELLEELADLL